MPRLSYLCSWSLSFQVNCALVLMVPYSVFTLIWWSALTATFSLFGHLMPENKDNSTAPQFCYFPLSGFSLVVSLGRIKFYQLDGSPCAQDCVFCRERFRWRMQLKTAAHCSLGWPVHRQAAQAGLGFSKSSCLSFPSAKTTGVNHLPRCFWSVSNTSVLCCNWKFLPFKLLLLRFGVFWG